ncbi:tumor necrosis factor receptor superfamily member 4 isoform X2 [Perca fluviatilis]|uniref:tumor necrosis factor receptor superfamily member 4 isoform X2 n=1 Tax=Perca fluviatilis TaxID=8168 RepID=UPI001962ABA7|nr:tumor necrosis factor receptor superfamily member 4 isoform X2 [Perca fluviatilis]
MVLLKLLILTLTFYELIVDLDAKTCPKGQRQIYRRGNINCESCPNEFYQPEENPSQYCKPCTRCETAKGSVVKENCTKVTNRKCQCRGKFVPSQSDSSICKCDIGFGLKDTGTEIEHCIQYIKEMVFLIIHNFFLPECLMCDHGYFSTQINSPCEKWRECKSGVKIPGTRTSDVICNPELNPNEITPPISNKNVSLITRLTTKHPLEGAQTQRMHSTTTTTTTTTTTAIPSRDPTQDTGNYIGMALLIFGIIGLLVLTALTCKLHITPQPAVLPKNDSLCRRPVEESGDGSLSSLKLYPGDHYGDESVN